MTDYLTLVGTAVNKQPRQLFGIATRTVKSSVFPRLPIDFDARYENQIPEDFKPCTEPIRQNTIRLQESTAETRNRYAREAAAALEGNITFLNETVLFKDGSAVSVDAKSVLEKSLHWQLKCWGFEHLKPFWLSSHDPSEVSDDELAVHRAWLDDWVGNHPIATESGYLRRYWMPHSVCLRILNWARYDSLFEDRLDAEFRTEIRRFIYKNTAFLADNVEHGVGGNHLVENAAALVVAGVYANEPAWRKQGCQIFEQAAENQFFEDGGHIERSPMYHLIVCQRFLTAVDILWSIGEGSEKILWAAKKGINFVERLRPPDNRIPLINDSVFGESLPLNACILYASNIGIDLDVVHISQKHGLSLPFSGFYWLGEGDTRLLVAAHRVSIPHLPGHAHVHPGHLMLWVDGKRVFTDTGVFEYTPGRRRETARSVRSHNTVQVGDNEPVRMGSSFWMWGDLFPQVKYVDNSSIQIDYSVSGIRRPTYSHNRIIETEPDGWRITDRIECKIGSVVGRFHIHPYYEPHFVDNEIVTINDNEGESLLNIRVPNSQKIEINDAPYYPYYGEEHSRSVIAISRKHPGSFTIELKR